MLSVEISNLFAFLVLYTALVVWLCHKYLHKDKKTSSRTVSVGSQSQCTYRRDLTQPCFRVVPAYLQG